MEELSVCQEKALLELEKPHNVFLTGVAGSGKSTLLRVFLKGKESKKFPILASTGAAAILVGGRTFHSFFGLGVMEGGVERTVERALCDGRVKKRIRQACAIIIDEVSMLSGETLDAAEWIATKARKVDEPWGGLKVIAVGDFAQLPPVSIREKSWAFQDLVWERTKFKPFILHTIVRAKDESFIKILNFVRNGIVNAEVRDFLDSHTKEIADHFVGTRLFPRKGATEAYNRKRLKEIPEEEKIFTTEYSGKSQGIKMLKKQAPIAETLHLKQGAFVMLRQNDPAGRWVNGSLGYVRSMGEKKLDIGLLSGRQVVIEKSTFSLANGDGETIATARNFPMNLAYATTIHKAQGSTFDKVHLDLRRLWEPGHAYVALSRVRQAGDLSLMGWTQDSFRISPAVSDFHASIGF